MLREHVRAALQLFAEFLLVPGCPLAMAAFSPFFCCFRARVPVVSTFGLMFVTLQGYWACLLAQPPNTSSGLSLRPSFTRTRMRVSSRGSVRGTGVRRQHLVQKPAGKRSEHKAPAAQGQSGQKDGDSGLEARGYCGWTESISHHFESIGNHCSLVFTGESNHSRVS